jgi:hypothetical protein
VNRFILIGKIHRRVHIWKFGMPNWQRLEQLPEFKDALKSASELPEVPPTKTEPAHTDVVVEEPSVRLDRDKRKGLRAPLIAKIVMANEKGVSVGICRDISVGGMQVLTDQIPDEVGKRIRLNVSSGGTPDESDDRPRIDAFTAEGVIVRILEDKRGFSFRFEKLSNTAKKAIERFIGSSPGA